MGKTFATLALAAALAAATPAQADVLYDFAQTPTPGLSVAAQFVISDAAAARGSFSFAGADGHLTGDTADFRSLRVSVRGTGLGAQTDDYYTAGVASPLSPYFFGTLPVFNLAFTFDPEGDVTSSAFFTGGTLAYLRLSGSGDTASGTLVGDYVCTHTCAVTGAWSAPQPIANAVPEPASLLLLGAGVAFIYAQRRRPIEPIGCVGRGRRHAYIQTGQLA